MKKRLYIYIIAAACLFPLEGRAQGLDDYLDGARIGNRTSQYNAGICYKYGYGTPVDEIEAFRWLRLAAEQGCADAQTQIGVWYHDGYAGLKPNSAEALNWHLKAAAQGSALSQYLSGRQYIEGDGTEVDWATGFIWLEKAAAQNLAMANTFMGLCYLDGVGRQVDAEEGNRLIRKGADGGDSQALTMIDERIAAVRPALDKAVLDGRLPEGFVYESYNNGLYVGELGRRGLRYGSGIYLWDSGVSYMGEWDDGLRSGYGSTDYGTSVHYGPYVNSRPRGNGILVASTGNALEGMNGGTVYAGGFVDGEFDGTGTLYDSTGRLIYYGGFRNGRPTDIFTSAELFGSYRWERQHYPDGEVYEGETVDGIRSGLGIYRWDDGALWFGVWSNGARGGEGIYISADGRTVSGSWLGNELQ